MRFAHTRPATGAVFALLTILSACASAPEPEPSTSPSQAGLDLMERLTLNADRCWFKSGDPAFDGYGLAPELASFSGKPRFLLTPAGQPEARPLLVVEGQSGSADVSIYGPLLSEEIGQRARADVLRWQSGSDDCVV
ncbi:hypothetical protein DYI37_04640 [Fulvimarina endophytica]|uniref:Lipoprotein n=1 Tax=Fulvimarina endophytica TaxID=2293836 RepID=A0A371X7E1_9HYPH|nr:hypothetical protein [Fulvimarina endophytica]RFC65143.1 hypothetical protein DYI37_04640 [Fulvimarina endophytica]